MLSLSLLGKVELTISDKPPHGAVTAKVIALLCYLVVTRQPHSRHLLAGLLWGDSPEEKAKTSLRVALSALRKVLPEHIEADRLTVRLRSDAPTWCDLIEWEQLIEAGQLAEAAALARGRFMADFHIEGADAFEEWLSAQRATWDQKAIDCFSQAAVSRLEARDYKSGTRLLRRLLDFDPWNEEAHRQLIVALCRMRDFNGALAQYRTCCLLLEKELGVAPMPETTALYDRVLRIRASVPPPLPAVPTPFIGRENEISTLHANLLNPACRLVTLVGMGGMGKTHLAIAVGHRVALEEKMAFLDGVTFVPLQGIGPESDIDSVAQSIAQALDATLPGRRSPATELVAFLRSEERLLILDNFEQLRHAAPWIDQLMQQCPTIKLLVTSREALHISTEWRYELAGLACAAEKDRAAVQLLSALVQRRGGEFKADQPCARQLCKFVDGVPLALKMVADWITTFTCDTVLTQLQNNLDMLATRLQDVPPRQRSMRVILDQTWESLSAAEQNALTALSTFRGGFDETAAMHMSACTPPLLLRLRERGLVQLDSVKNRFNLHDLLRHYVAERRPAAAAATNAHEHAAYFARLVATEREMLLGKTQRATLRRLQPDIDNLRLAWRTAIEQGDVALVCQMLEGWARLLYAESLDKEAIDALSPAIALLEPSQYRRSYAQVLLWLAVFHHSQFQLAVAERYWTLLQKVGAELGDLTLEARALVGLGSIANLQDDYDRAMLYSEQALQLYEAADERTEAIRSLNNLGLAYQARGQSEKAVDFYKRAIEAAKSSVDESLSTTPSVNLGFVLTSMGRYEAAYETLQTLLETIKHHGWNRTLPQTYYHLGRVSWYSGEYDRAIDYFQKSRSRYQTADEQARVDRTLGRLYALKGNFNRARKLARGALMVHQRDENASSIGIAHSHLGMIESLAGNFEAARHHFEEALTILDELERVPIFEHAQLAWVFLQTGQPERARRLLDDGKALAEQFPSPREAAWLETIEAAVQLAQGEQETAVATLNGIVQLAYITADNRAFAQKLLATEND